MAEGDPPEPPPLLRQPESRQLRMHELILKHGEGEVQRELFRHRWRIGCLSLIACSIVANAALAASIR